MSPKNRARFLSETVDAGGGHGKGALTDFGVLIVYAAAMMLLSFLPASLPPKLHVRLLLLSLPPPIQMRLRCRGLDSE
jgi:hypothetical protein